MTRPLSRPEATAAHIQADVDGDLGLGAAYLNLFGPGPHWTQPTSARQTARRDHDETHAEQAAWFDRWDPDIDDRHMQDRYDNWLEREQ